MFFLYQTEFAGQAGHTIAQWHVADIEGEVRDLKDKGITFEHYDLPGMTGTATSRRSPGWVAPPGSRTARTTSCASTTWPSAETHFR